VWDSLGYAHHHLGNHHDAAVCYQRSIDLYRDYGARYDEATTLARLAESHRATGDTVAARTAWRQALAILDDLAHPDAEQVRTRLDTVEAGWHP